MNDVKTDEENKEQRILMLKMVLALLERIHRSSQKSYVTWCHTRGHRQAELAADVRDRGGSGVPNAVALEVAQKST